MTTTLSPAKPLRPLKGVRIVSLALNLPGPAAMMRLHAMGAHCTKLEPPPPAGAPEGSSGDPMGLYNPQAYGVLHQGITIASLDLKSEKGQKALHQKLAKADVLLTSFRPSALHKLGLDWKTFAPLAPSVVLGANCWRQWGTR